MSAIELIRRFSERKIDHNRLRHPAVVVLEFGGGNCNKAGESSCRDFCAVPNGKPYDPGLDPSPSMLIDQFRKIAALKPAVVSIVPNGEAVITYQKSNCAWGEVFCQMTRGNLSEKQSQALIYYYSKKYQFDSVNQAQAMDPAEKMALCLALGKNAGLNLSLTTNGSFLDKDLLKLYREMGLEYVNLSFHPNKSFDPQKLNPDLEHLIKRANEAIEVGIIPTITHVLTRQNADTFVALVDYVTEHDIFFAVGIANTRGGKFSTNNQDVEPTENQVKMVFRRLLARKLFADRHIRTTIPYLLMAPFLRHWVCDQATDFFHVSIEKTDGKLQSKLNVCSEIRPTGQIELGDFFKNGFDNNSYLNFRSEIKQGCQGCTHQCFFESETRGTLSIGNNLERWDWWDSFGKGARQRYTLRHPIRPVVSQRADFQNPYLWESFLQGIARIVAGLKENKYWQETFKRSGIDYRDLLNSCIHDATNPDVINELVQLEKHEVQIKAWQVQQAEAKKRNVIFSLAFNWHDSENFQSRFLRAVYKPFQRSSQEAGMAIPLKFRSILKHESPVDFKTTIESILAGEREEESKLRKGILHWIKKIKRFLSSNYLYNWLWVPSISKETIVSESTFSMTRNTALQFPVMLILLYPKYFPDNG